MKTRNIILTICLVLVWGVFALSHYFSNVQDQEEALTADTWFNSLPPDAQKALNDALALIKTEEHDRARKISLLNCAAHITTVAQSRMPDWDNRKALKSPNDLDTLTINYFGQKTGHTLGADGLGNLVLGGKPDDSSICTNLPVSMEYKTTTVPDADMNYYE